MAIPKNRLILLRTKGAAIMEALALERPVLLGWSYGGIVAGDYLARYGTGNIRALITVGAAAISGGRGDLFGDALKRASRAMCVPDAQGMIEATHEFMRRISMKPLNSEMMRHMKMQPKREDDIFATLLCAAMMTPVHVRRAVMRRKVDHFPLLRTLDIPALVMTGMMDRAVLPQMATEIAAAIPGARLLRYEGVGHAPFLEEAWRFDADVAAFVREVLG
jgi:non-heme chloroperoxidase